MANHEKTGGSHVSRETERPADEIGRSRVNEEEAPRQKSTSASGTKKKKSSAKRRKRRLRRLRNTVIVMLSLVLVLCLGALYAGSRVSASTVTLPNVYLDGIDVSGLTKEQVRARLQEQGWDREGQIPLTVQLPAGQSFTVDRLAAGAVMPLSDAVDAVFAYGHSGNWLADLGSYLTARVSPVNLGAFTVYLNEAYVAQCVNEGIAAFSEATAGPTDFTVNRESETLDIVKGAGELRLNPDLLRESVMQALLAGGTECRYDTLENPPQAPDFAAIHEALLAEPQDAYFVEGGWDVVEEVVGCDFAVDQAAALWSAADWMETVQVPLNIDYPAVTAESLRSMLFRDKLGAQTTYFPNSIENRISNIQLAASKIDGIVLNPGDIFSYNDTVGERTPEAGFQMAAAYSNGEVVEEIGGGVCQVSSTLYCAVLYSQLGIKSRDSHYFKVDYLPWGQDATVSWPGPDFKFQNTREYPIRIHAYADPVEKSVTMEIWGTDTDGTYIELSADRYRITDDTYGVQIGWNVYLYASIYDRDGNLLRVEERAPSTYHFHDEEIQWPT